MTDPWRCPNTQACPHPGLLHDVEDYDDLKPMCCAEGCTCGKAPVEQGEGGAQ